MIKQQTSDQAISALDQIAKEFADRGVSIVREILTQDEKLQVDDAAASLRKLHSSIPLNDLRSGRYLNHELPAQVKELAFLPTLVRIATHILGDNVALYHARVLIKDRHSNEAVQPHQDSPYSHGLDNKLHIFLPLTPNTRSNGCLKFWANSHKYGLVGKGDIDPAQFDETEIVWEEVFPGDVMLMQHATWHASEQATTEEERFLLQVVYQPSDDGSYVSSPELVSGEWLTQLRFPVSKALIDKHAEEKDSLSREVTELKEELNQIKTSNAKMANNRLFVALCIITAVIPSLVAAAFIHRFGYNTFLIDDFGFMSPLGELLQGRFPLAQLLDQHNNHRSFFGYLMMFGLGFITKFSSISQMYLSLAFTVSTLAFASLITIDAVGRGKLALLLCAANSLVLLSLRHNQTFLYGIVFMNSMATCFLVISLYLLGHAVKNDGARSVAWCSLAIVSAIISTFSGNIVTILIWPIGLTLLAYVARLHRRRRLFLYEAGVWAGFSIANIAAYFINYNASEMSAGSATPGKLLHYLILVTGGTIFGDQNIAAAAGTILVIFTAIGLAVAAYRASKFRLELNSLPAVCLVLFAVGAILMITKGRAGLFDVQQALSSRYSQFGAVGTCGLLALCATSLPFRAWTKYTLSGVLIALIGLGYLHCLLSSGEIGERLLSERKELAYRLRTYAIQSDVSLAKLGWGVPRPLAILLHKHQYNVFADKIQRLADVQRVPMTIGFCVDRIGHMPVAGAISKSGAESTVEICGWAYDAEHNVPASAVFLRIENYGEIPACYGLYRPDVSKYFGIKFLEKTGFFVTFNGKLLSPGAHTVSLIVTSFDQTKNFESRPIGTLMVSNSGRILFNKVP